MITVKRETNLSCTRFMIDALLPLLAKRIEQWDIYFHIKWLEMQTATVLLFRVLSILNEQDARFALLSAKDNLVNVSSFFFLVPFLNDQHRCDEEREFFF
jgi:hypothetical protein